MKLLLTTLLIGAVVLTATPAQADWKQDRWKGPCDGWRYGELLTTPARFNENVVASKIKMARLVTCVFATWAPGNEHTALMVAERESGLMPWARNLSSDCRGLFQHMGRYWDSRVRAYLWKGWFRRWPAVWSDPRANAIVAAKMVAAGGWGPWTTARS